MLNNLSKNISSTIAYYDVMDYPLTAFEVWKYLIKNQSSEEKEPCSLAEVIKELESEDIKQYSEEFNGFYFLIGRKNLVEQRIKREKTSQKKLKIIKRVVWWLRFVPFVRMVAVTGRVAMKNADEKSDLDLLIALKVGKIFTSRILTTLMVQLLGKRRYGQKITNRICLNYFITDESLEIDAKDIYASSEYNFMFPLFGAEIFQKFQKANAWISDFKINYQADEVFGQKIMADSCWSKNIRKVGEVIFSFDFIEKNLKKWQLKRIMNDPRTHQRGSGVSASDQALVFLPDLQGPKVYGKFREKMTEMGI